MDLLEITRLSGGPLLDLIRWLQGENCLANPLRCSQCNERMLLTARNQDHVDGYLWFVCAGKSCLSNVSPSLRQSWIHKITYTLLQRESH